MHSDGFADRAKAVSPRQRLRLVSLQPLQDIAALASPSPGFLKRVFKKLYADSQSKNTAGISRCPQFNTTHSQESWASGLDRSGHGVPNRVTQPLSPR
jgi:hypothetical protein